MPSLKSGFYSVWYFGDNMDAHKMHIYVQTFLPDMPRGRGVARWSPTHVGPRIMLCVFQAYVPKSKCISEVPFLAF